MCELQLPQFQSHPECAAGLITVDQAIALIQRGWLTLEGAQYLLPPRAWVLLPQPSAMT
ncbi:MAG TPA: hypothetical protein V6D19_15105 [Stenomitos sp.]